MPPKGFYYFLLNIGQVLLQRETSKEYFAQLHKPEVLSLLTPPTDLLFFNNSSALKLAQTVALCFLFTSLEVQTPFNVRTAPCKATGNCILHHWKNIPHTSYRWIR
ncbi:hypothetical protein UY3_07563 [Chelonia mydas]|uniref:Uncharacterized protein n=1 Tax=Chelonia mydas TaxID=8469 RepID=M7BI04_CHEMY|nr:hypothetical protein UY3_07563 [Chelonia mydas]